jgi:putative transposase
MLLSKIEVFKNDKTSNDILRHMGYSAYKLWNVGIYEKKNHKELGMVQYPNCSDQKKRLKSNFFYKNLPIQTALDVLQFLEEVWKSFLNFVGQVHRKSTTAMV